jgi:hypothetical protein
MLPSKRNRKAKPDSFQHLFKTLPWIVSKLNRKMRSQEQERKLFLSPLVLKKDYLLKQKRRRGLKNYA